MTARIIALTALTIAIVVAGSLLSVSLWGGKSEEIELPEITISSADQTPAQIIKQNNLPPKPILRALGVDSSAAATTTLAQLGFSPDQAQTAISRMLIQFNEEQTKNWRKIAVKFALWFVFLPIPFILMLRRKISPRRRKVLLGIGIALFGIALGSDPSPMGTVKDAVYLIAAHQTVFMPRIIAFTVFMLTVIVANKFICSWGCQFGLLQEFLFRVNRRRFDRKGLLRQYKPPFWLTNSIRIAVFVVFTIVATLWAFDLIGLIDPFKIYHPSALIAVGIVFIAIVLIASLFVYRPWCHFACPFGLVSWLGEKISIFRIKVDYHKCDACNLCHRACPSNVMEAILKRDRRTIPDCFSCGTCIDVCPQDAIHFTASREDRGIWADSLAIRERKQQERKALRA
jgi:ferredoxin